MQFSEMYWRQPSLNLFLFKQNRSILLMFVVLLMFFFFAYMYSVFLRIVPFKNLCSSQSVLMLIRDSARVCAQYYLCKIMCVLNSYLSLVLTVKVQRYEGTCTSWISRPIHGQHIRWPKHYMKMRRMPRSETM